MVNITKYKRHKNGFGLYSLVHTVSKTSEESESFVSDQCSWESLIKEYPNRIQGKFDLVWKTMVIQGLNYGLSKIHHNECIEIVLKDIQGHVMHSNNYSMFAAGILAAFAELKVKVDDQDLENLYEFVGSSKGEGLDAIPNVSELVFKTYRI
ncbi:hypothetical protein [uncultured Aquimarina sp.]|uniref:hypothetical protein n=1 Tax=uncultured Aquimarina sp. TaxID=575652 RepID=UPI00261D7506|nr:hypothetical protein [uncultured Aquimarina sp.]